MSALGHLRFRTQSSSQEVQLGIGNEPGQNSTVLKLRRVSNMWRDRSRAYRVLLDGDEVGRLRPGQLFECNIAPGAHRLALKIDFGGSVPVDFEAAPANVVCFTAEPGSFVDLLRPSRWILLRHANADLP